ncbi:hypothetical protein SASPL_133325 [Salvia splendens]|uniref:Uncharacterized protein n=1 Tax=Salvia splendens TaxID=180675 RepID=A0A8X8ZI81_SALSN|nr:hypothetical protein SASPL_133324 [Salvia splendens]KAG6405731.1 hypothetical protein SASPL_133325 [Salvia splendens]
MGLWTLLEGFLLLANALAILNEDRFLAPRGWSFLEYSGIKRNSLKGQILGLIYATQYLIKSASHTSMHYCENGIRVMLASLNLKGLFHFSCMHRTALLCLRGFPCPWPHICLIKIEILN